MNKDTGNTKATQVLPTYMDFVQAQLKRIEDGLGLGLEPVLMDAARHDPTANRAVALAHSRGMTLEQTAALVICSLVEQLQEHHRHACRAAAMRTDKTFVRLGQALDQMPLSASSAPPR